MKQENWGVKTVVCLIKLEQTEWDLIVNVYRLGNYAVSAQTLATFIVSSPLTFITY